MNVQCYTYRIGKHGVTVLTCYHVAVPYSIVRSLIVLQCSCAVPYSVVPYSVYSVIVMQSLTVLYIILQSLIVWCGPLQCYRVVVQSLTVWSLTVLQCYSDAVPYSVV